MTILAQTGVFSWGLQYTKYGSGTVSAANAYAKQIFTVVPTDGQQLVLGATTYTFKTTLTPSAGQVLIGASLNTALTHLVEVIMNSGGSGTDWAAGTTTPNASASAVLAYNTIFYTALATGSAGNSIALSTTVTGVTTVGFQGGLTAGAFNLSLLTYDRHRANDIDFGPVQDSRIFPLEVGGVITPTGAYKAGVYSAGGATILPRLDGTFGDLLLALLGQDTVTVNSPVSGANTHDFQINPNAVDQIPWVFVRKDIPGSGAVRPFGVMGADCKLAQMQIMIPQNDVVSVRVDFAGRTAQFDNYADAWLFGNVYETAGRVPISCKGDFQLPTIFSNNLPVTNVVVTIVNNITTPRQEMIIGSYNPDDFAVISRVMTIRFVFKWSDPSLYQYLLTGASGPSANTWTPTPFITNWNSDSNPNHYAFQADIQATDIITGTTPYSMTIRAGSVVWQPNGPITLRGGGILAMEVLGTVLDNSLGVPYAEILLVNGKSTAYAAPAAP